ncbi:hypothetical protein LTR28_000271, partial [Elasticomyces elasticus]
MPLPFLFSLALAASPCQAFLLPLFLPVFTSRRLAQQQQRAIWITEAIMLAPLAIHMKTNIFVPRVAPMLRSATEVNALRMMMNMTVAMTLAPVVQSAATKVKKPMGSAAH